LEQEAFDWFLKSSDVATSREVLEKYQEIYAKSGMKGVFDFFSERGFRTQTKPFDAAGYCAVAGRVDQAFELLEETYALPTSVPFFADARFDSLRGDSRYVDLMRRLKLPEETIRRYLDTPS
jgi:hypothetical protein